MKRKTGQVTKNKLKKPKTLAEKRDQLQDDIMKYGVAAIEKMYPRYAFYRYTDLYTTCFHEKRILIFFDLEKKPRRLVLMGKICMVRIRNLFFVKTQ